MSVKAVYRPRGEHSQAYWRLMIWLFWHSPCSPVFLCPLLPSCSLSLMDSDIIPYSSHHWRLIFLGILIVPLVVYLITSSCVQVSFCLPPPDSAALLYPSTADLLLFRSASQEGKIYTRSSHASYLRPEGFSFPSSVLNVMKICDVLFQMHNLLTDEASRD